MLPINVSVPPIRDTIARLVGLSQVLIRVGAQLQFAGHLISYFMPCSSINLTLGQERDAFAHAVTNPLPSFCSIDFDISMSQTPS